MAQKPLSVLSSSQFNLWLLDFILFLDHTSVCKQMYEPFLRTHSISAHRNFMFLFVTPVFFLYFIIFSVFTCIHIYDLSCWPWQYFSFTSVSQWRPATVRTTAPLSSSPYQRPCLSATSYRTHTSCSGRHPLPRFESSLIGEWKGDYCVRMHASNVCMTR